MSFCPDEYHEVSLVLHGKTYLMCEKYDEEYFETLLKEDRMRSGIAYSFIFVIILFAGLLSYIYEKGQPLENERRLYKQ